MFFDKTKIFTSVNADDAQDGSTGYFANTLQDLIDEVKEEDQYDYGILLAVGPETSERRFLSEAGETFSLFYQVE